MDPRPPEAVGPDIVRIASTPNALPIPNPDRWTLLFLVFTAGLIITLIEQITFGNSLAGQVTLFAFFGLIHLPLLIKAPGYFALYFLILFNGVGQIGSNIILNLSFYVYETGALTYDIGAMPLLVFSLSVFYFAFLCVITLLDRKTEVVAIKGTQHGIIALAAIPLLIGVAAVILYGSPLFTGAARDRFLTESNIPQFFRTFGINRVDLAVLLGGVIFALSRERTNRIIGVTLFLVATLIALLEGGRGGAVVSSTLLFGTPLLLTQNELAGRMLRRVFLIGAITMAMMLLVTLGSILLQSQTALADLGGRLVLQGHVWWDIFYIKTRENIGATGASVWNEFSSFFDFAPGRTLRGSELVLRLVAPNWIYDNFVELGARFASSWPAIGLYYFGPYGLLIAQCILGSAYGLFAVIFRNCVLTGRFLSTLVLYFAWQQILLEVVLMGELYKLFNIRAIIFLVLYIAARVCELQWRSFAGTLLHPAPKLTR